MSTWCHGLPRSKLTNTTQAGRGPRSGRCGWVCAVGCAIPCIWWLRRALGCVEIENWWCPDYPEIAYSQPASRWWAGVGLVVLLLWRLWGCWWALLAGWVAAGQGLRVVPHRVLKHMCVCSVSICPSWLEGLCATPLASSRCLSAACAGSWQLLWCRLCWLPSSVVACWDF